MSKEENLAEHILNNPCYYSERSIEWARKELKDKLQYRYVVKNEVTK